jgi:hypothetical protein
LTSPASAEGATVETLLEGLFAQALAKGLDLDRAVVAHLLFHPQFDGMTFTWTWNTGRAERQAATQPDIRRLPSPFLHMQTTGTEGLRYRLDDRGALPFPPHTHLRSLGQANALRAGARAREIRIEATPGRLIHAKLSNRMDADRLARQTTRRENPATSCSFVLEPSHG